MRSQTTQFTLPSRKLYLTDMSTAKKKECYHYNSHIHDITVICHSFNYCSILLLSIALTFKNM